MKKPTVPQRAQTRKSGIDVGAIDALAKIVGQYDLSEIVVEVGSMHVRVARERAATPAPLTHVVAAAPALAAGPTAAVAPPALAAPPPERALADHVGAVKSPMVGTAYLRPSPEARPFVEVGSVVKTGDKIMLVEAMKTFNEIVAPRSGAVTHIFIEDGAPVEYGQALMIIE